MIRMTTLAAAALLLAGCVEQPEETFGKRLQTEGGEVSALGAKWSEGQEAIAEGRALIEEGEENIEEGEDLVSEGEKQVRRGEKLVREGEKKKAEAEEAYRLRNAGS